MKFPFLFSLVIALSLSTSLFAQDEATATLLADIKRNETYRIDKDVELGADVNYRDVNQATILMWAALKTNLATVKKLVALGADPRVQGVIFHDEEKTGFYGSLMSIAAGEKNMELLKYLVEEIKIPVNEREFDPATNGVGGWTAIDWAANNNDKKMIEYLLSKGAKLSGEAITNGGFMYYIRSQYQDAIDWTEYIFNISKGTTYNDSTLAVTHFIVGSSCLELDQNAKAESELTKAFQHLQAYKGPAHRLHYIITESYASLHGKKKNYQKAIELLSAMEKNRDVLDSENQLGVFPISPREANLYNTLGVYYSNLKQYSDSEKYYKKALDVARGTNRTANRGTADILENLGTLKLEQEKFEEAKTYFTQSINEVKNYQPVDSYLGLGKVAAELGDAVNAEKYINTGLQKTIARFGEGSKQHLNVLSNNLPVFFVKTRNFGKIVPFANTYLKYQLKNLSAMTSPVDDIVKGEIQSNLEEHIDTYLLLAAQNCFVDTTFVSSVYNYHLITGGLINNQKKEKIETWQKIQKSISTKEAFVDIIPARTFKCEKCDRYFPDFYAVVFSKTSKGPYVLPLYDTRAPSTTLMQGYERFTQSSKQDIPSLAQAWLAATKEFEGVKKVNVRLNGQKIELRNLHNLNTSKYFLDEIKADVVVK